MVINDVLTGGYVRFQCLVVGYITRNQVATKCNVNVAALCAGVEQLEMF